MTVADNVQRAQTLAELFQQRVKATPKQVAYRHFDKENKVWQSIIWQEMATHVVRWQAALAGESLSLGDRVAVMLRNGPNWVLFDQAALSLGLVTVPLYPDDRPDNVAYILADAAVKLLLIEGSASWQRLFPLRHKFTELTRIVTVQKIEDKNINDARLVTLDNWLSGHSQKVETPSYPPETLASIVYTSGTTGRPKGVMLSHQNILTNTQAVAQAAAESRADFSTHDLFLSFLPLSHMLERTAGYYLPMFTGATVAYARSIPQLNLDLTALSPTILISVPRIYEQVYSKIQNQLEKKSWFARKLFFLTVEIGWQWFEYQQGRRHWQPLLLLWPLLQRSIAIPILEKLGGRMRLAICGGAALPPKIDKLFVGLGLTLLQGYGLTESSPVITVNRPHDNIPSSIGTALPGIDIQLSEDDELLTRSPCIMLGYWNNPSATEEVIDEQGWLHTGDKASQDRYGHWHITGRIKDIIVMGNGEKIPPADMEMRIISDNLFDQVLIVGEGKPFLSALVVLNQEHWRQFAHSLDVEPNEPESFQAKLVHKAILARIKRHIKDFPGYAQIRRVTLLLEPWTVDSGLLTPTLKMKRAQIMERYAAPIERMYQGF